MKRVDLLLGAGGRKLCAVSGRTVSMQDRGVLGNLRPENFLIAPGERPSKNP